MSHRTNLNSLMRMLGRLVKKPEERLKDQNGGTNCATCTVIIGLVDELSVKESIPISDAMERLCNLIPDAPLKEGCDWLIQTFGKDVIEGLESLETPDDICRTIDICKSKSCNLFPKSPTAASNVRAKSPRAKVSVVGGEPFPLKWLIDLINRIANEHEPIVDVDNDLFSPLQTLRGWDWRGKDCDDFNKLIHPGRVDPLKDASVDSDCNGIYGSNSNGQSYEQLFCSGSDRRGTAVIGDSAGAHFEIPPRWFTVAEWNDTTFKGAQQRIEDEFDVPFGSFSTGYVDNRTAGPVDSVYLHNRARNLCNHRDYQNCGVNGERSGSIVDLVSSIGRNQTIDHPITLIYELVGNDVCHSGPGGDTPKDEFRANTLKALTYLDDHFPAGSAVLMIGLADGSLLWDALHNRTHPIGVPYPVFYDYLNCLSISPCYGWMNSNATERNITTEWGYMLNTVYRELVSNTTVTSSFKNIKIDYMDFPLNNYKTWYSGPIWELIEPVDGFHPNQLANYYIAQQIVKFMNSQTAIKFLSDVNPMNADIIKQFGENLNGY